MAGDMVTLGCDLELGVFVDVKREGVSLKPSLSQVRMMKLIHHGKSRHLCNSSQQVIY